MASLLEPLTKVVLNGEMAGVCRFCKLRKPAAKFKKVAHAIPECLGNKSLTSTYECDACNTLFGEGIETHFGSWSKEMRAISGVNGKNGVPTLKNEKFGWRIENGPDGLKISQTDENPVAAHDPDNQRLIFSFQRDSYVPVAAMKALVKIGLTLLPDDEMPNFEEALSWIRNPDHQVGLVKDFPILHTFVPGVRPLPGIAIILLRRKRDDIAVPYATYVLSYGNDILQVVLPTPERDKHIHGKSLQYQWFPNPYEVGVTPVAPLQRELLDLTGRAVLKGETVTLTMRYDTAGSIPPSAN